VWGYGLLIYQVIGYIIYMKNNSLKVMITLSVAGIMAAVGYLLLDFGGSESIQTPSDPTGFITFTAHESGTDRNFPQIYDVVNKEFLSPTNNSDTFYIQTVPGQITAYIQAQFFERTPADMSYPFTGNPQLVRGSDSLELNVISPGELSWSSEAQQFTFHGLSQNITRSTEPGYYFAPENYQNSANWGVYTADLQTGVVQEIVSGHSPVWSVDGEYVFYLTVSGVHVYEISSGLSWAVISLPERLPTPASSLAVSSDGGTLHVLTTAAAISPDRLFLYDVSTLNEIDLANASFQLLRMVNLPDGKYGDYTISPDDNYASVISYGSGSFKTHLLNLQTEKMTMELEFEWLGLEKYYHYPYLSWTTLSPSSMD